MKWVELKTFELKSRDASLGLVQDFTSEQGWIAATAPGTVHEALLAAGQISDPYYGLNELAVQWIGEKTWLYRTEFDAPVLARGEQVDLCLDGLDTLAQVWLNGEPILQSQNMFIPHRIDVTKRLLRGTNRLWLSFEPVLPYGKALEALHGKGGLWNGDSSRLYVRKAQYHYGWDWGPTLLTAGPWRPVRLEVGQTRIEDLSCPVELNAALDHARFKVSLNTIGSAEGAQIRLSLSDDLGNTVHESLHPAQSHFNHTIELEHPRLWWPNGYGEQPLYFLEVRLEHGSDILAEATLQLGVRKLDLRQEAIAGEAGRSFCFAVNGQEIFCGGANWIPEDLLLPRVGPEQYRTRLQQACEANMQMIRVWGGGVYEADVFYDLCDEMGLLVWQDFMFACGEYPAFPEFVESVRLEAQAQVKRLRHHPCLALWCGNNEDYQYQSHAGRYNPEIAPENDKVFRARVIYENVLAEVCRQLDPQRPYRPGSPYGGHDPDDPTQGDRHTWEVWHRGMAPYQTYDDFRGRFVSEFGMQGAPALSTIRRAIPAEEQHPSSRTFEHHNKATGGHRHVAVYVSDNLALPEDLEAYVYATQFVQAEALGYAYREWRRRFGTPGKRSVAGALVWQLNDCWPVQSWAVVDSSGIPKPAYAVIARELAPLVVGVRRSLKGYGQTDGVELWAVNGTAKRWSGMLEIKLYDLYGLVSQEQRSIALEPDGVTELNGFKLQNPYLIVTARLLDDQGVQARASAWPEPFKYLQQPEPGLQIGVAQDALRLQVTHPLKGLHLEAEGVTFEDNHIDLFPDEERLVRGKGLGAKAVQARYLKNGACCIWQPKPEGAIGD